MYRFWCWFWCWWLNWHCLYHLLPPRAHRSYHLLPPTAHRSYRKHGYQLPRIEYNLHKNSFINRCLFHFRWLLFFTSNIILRSVLYHCLATQIFSTAGIYHTVLSDLCVLCLLLSQWLWFTLSLVYCVFTLCILLCVPFVHMYGLFVLIVVVGTAFYVCMFYSCNGVRLSYWNEIKGYLTWLDMFFFETQCTVWVKKSPLPRFSGIFFQMVGNFSTKFYTPIMRSYLC